MSTLQQKQCPMCSFECPSVAVLLSHLRLVHSSDPRFLVCCGINSCTVTSRSFSALYSHVYRHHSGVGIRRRTVNSSSLALPTASEYHEEDQEIQSTNETAAGTRVCSPAVVYRSYIMYVAIW